MLGAARLTDGLAKLYASYAEFEAAETARSNVEVTWGTSTSLGWAIYRTTAGSPAGSLYGSPHLGRMGAGDPNAPCRVVQHSLPSEAVFNDLVANPSRGLVVFTVVSAPDNFSGGITRNGFTSTGPYGGGDSSGLAVTDVRAWIPGLGPMRRNPSLNTAWSPYILGT